MRLYARPHPVVPRFMGQYGPDGIGYRSLAGGSYTFAGCEVLMRDGGRITACNVDFRELDAWKDALGPSHRLVVDNQLDRMSSTRVPLAGLHWDRSILMGVINVTPDSFSDGGESLDRQSAIKRGLTLHEEGADIIDVGGESTRPGALPITIEEEIRRVIPVIEQLANYGLKVSVDTRHSEVMRLAVESGAEIINDVSALTNDPRSLELIAKLGVAVILMHMRLSLIHI